MSELTPEQSERLLKIFKTLWPFAGNSFETMELNFCRDIHPEREILIWEWIAARYTEFREEKSRTRNELENRFEELLKESKEKWPIVVLGPLGPPTATDGQHRHGER
ncbi:MAG: hypothetical protein FJ271_31660 [Planctomycetes bacterium]|nr:hypothetical protein [Planctomycetota bacterium]